MIVNVNAFTVFIFSFILLAPFFGYLGDRYNRKLIMIGGLSVWLVMTLCGSFVNKKVRQFCYCYHTTCEFSCTYVWVHMYLSVGSHVLVCGFTCTCLWVHMYLSVG